MPIDYTKYRLGTIPSSPDHRDLVTQAPTAARLAQLPAAITYGPMGPIQDQGQEGTCVGHALVGALSYHILEAGFSYVAARRDAYEGARIVAPVVGEGAQPRAALQNALQTGLCYESTWPYVVEQKGAPGPTAPAERLLIKVARYAAVGTDKDSLRLALASQGSPLFVMIPVFDGFYTPDVNGVVSGVGMLKGYHEIALIGYDDSKGAFRLRNSWGTGWGQSGYCWYPYSLTISEAWTLAATVLATPPAPKPWWSVFWPWGS